MKIKQTPLDDHQVELTVEIENEQMEAAKRRAARKLSERGKVPGFRPGKAPYDVVRRHYGDEAILEEALELLVDEIYPQALEQEKIQPVAPGSLEKVEGIDPAKFVFRVPLPPEVSLGNYRSLRKPYEFVAPDDEAVEQALQEMRQMYGTTKAVERPIQIEDFALINLRGEKVKPKEGEDPLVLERKGHAVYIAKEPRENEFPYQGFSRELIGLKMGDKKTFTHKFGKDVEDEALRGQTIRFEVDVRSVRGLELPELDDAFAHTTGLGETVDEMRANLRKQLEQREKENYDDAYYNDMMEEIRAGAVIKYPPQMLESEIEDVMKELKDRLSERGLDYETFLKMQGLDEAQFIEKEARPAAIRRLERRLVMDELVSAEKIEVDRQRAQEEFEWLWAALVENSQSFNKATNGGRKRPENIVRAVMMDVVSRLLVEATLERLKEIATGAAGKEEKARAKSSAEKTEADQGAEEEPQETKPKKRAASKKSE